MQKNTTNPTEQPASKPGITSTKTHRSSIRALAFLGGLLAAVGFTVYTTLADVPQPVLTIAPLGSNQYSISITNGDTNANYELYWTPVLASQTYPFNLLVVGDQGQTNFNVDAGAWISLWFRASVGTDWDSDGIPNYMDGNPSDSSVGALSVTIDSPVNGSALN